MKAYKAVHLLLMALAFVVVYLKFYGAGFDSFNSRLFNVISILVYVIGYVLLARVYNAYRVGMKRIGELRLVHTMIQFILMFAMYFVNNLAWLHTRVWIGPLPMITALIIQVLLTFTWTALAEQEYFKIYKPKKTIVIYRNKRDLRRLNCIANFTRQYEVIKYIENPEDDYKLLYSQIEGAEAIFTAGVKADLRNSVAKYCAENGVEGYFIPHIGDLLISGANHVQQFDTPIVALGGPKEDVEYMFVKRIFDIVVSFIGIVVLSWLMIIIAIVIRLSDGGPAIFKQVRLTRDGKEFNIYKFRSMRVDAEKDGVARLASEDDDRITSVGKFLRKCRLDELPQLFNILIGDMTIVGPRPERPEIAEQYKKVIPAFKLRLRVKAGLTGYAQVYGRYNTDPYDKLEMDLMYINKRNIFVDLGIIFATIAILFSKESTAGLEMGELTAMIDDEDFR